MLVKWFDRDTLLWVVPNYITETAIVLDIGCGIRPQEFFKPEVHICCEPCDEYVRVLQNK